MPKYRTLTQEELKDLEKEFIDFLVINGVTADEWQKLKLHEQEKSDKILEQFSDVVWEGVLRKTMFVEHRSPQDIRTFQCLSNKIVLMGIKIQDDQIDLRTKEGYMQLQQNMPSASVYSSEKIYSKNREMEIFELIQSGAQISDGSLFKNIALIVAESNA
jgi:hypothetical protein